eukprot:TRINITY_DN12829_c0_g1_i1.p2 TRINITY_DN12829_c0_g1~~TRINITY_DN12829_c0_g1_i1.p2  ORF type:complete len:375 (+),score=50.86 TRINITY_DN12829_c0_g1_i1:2491-3615(+)
MNLQAFVQHLQKRFPLNLAESWDNVGLLVEPTKLREVRRVFLTNDLTPQVMREAIDWKADFILSYHPPIFSPLKRLVPANPIQRVIIQALENNIAVYSPHTASDVARGGVNDWLASGLGGDVAKVEALGGIPVGATHKIVTFVPEDAVDRVRQAVSEAGAGTIGLYTQCSFSTKGTGTWLAGQGANPTIGTVGSLEKAEELRFETVCDAKAVSAVRAALKASHPYEEAPCEVYLLERSTSVTEGPGRLVTFQSPLPLSEVIGRIKTHLNLPYVRVARPYSDGKMKEDPKIKSVALCAGSGYTVLGGKPGDLYWTGEMRHHDVLASVAAGKCVVLCEHTNTERGFLRQFAAEIERDVPGTEVKVSEVDADPLHVE